MYRRLGALSLTFLRRTWCDCVHLQISQDTSNILNLESGSGPDFMREVLTPYGLLSCPQALCGEACGTVDVLVCLLEDMSAADKVPANPLLM